MTSAEAAAILQIDVSRVLVLCRQKRLGYTYPKDGYAWVITENEIEVYKALGPRPPGCPKKPKKEKLGWSRWSGIPN